jgi:hypothetical protein
MKTVRLYYFMTQFDGHIMDDIIGRSTHAANKQRMIECCINPEWFPLLSHGEVRLGDDMYTSTMGEMRRHGLLRNLFKKGTGTCVRPYSEVVDDPRRWLYIEFPVSNSGYTAILSWLRMEVANNDGYDFLCILSFLCNKRFHNSRKNICSEVQHRVVCLAGDPTGADERVICYINKFLNTWRDVPSPVLQCLNMLCCGFELRRAVDNSLVRLRY